MRRVGSLPLEEFYLGRFDYLDRRDVLRVDHTPFFGVRFARIWHRHGHEDYWLLFSFNDGYLWRLLYLNILSRGRPFFFFFHDLLLCTNLSRLLLLMLSVGTQTIRLAMFRFLLRQPLRRLLLLFLYLCSFGLLTFFLPLELLVKL